VIGSAAGGHVALPGDLDPSTEQARQWLSDELARSEYHDTRSLFQRLMDWLVERLADLQSTQGTGGASLPPIVITLVVVLVVVGVALLLTRIRVEGRSVRERSTLLGDSVLTAEQLRREAVRALAAGRFDDALMAWTRAIARDAESRTLLPDARSMTAHEVGAALAVAFPNQVADISHTMDRFDAVAYGDQAASREDATNARSTDAALHAAKPVLSTRTARGSRGGGPPPPATTGTSGAGTSEPDSVWLTGVRP
jgi:type II secretory pathway pseudopilin PulG